MINRTLKVLASNPKYMGTGIVDFDEARDDIDIINLEREYIQIVFKNKEDVIYPWHRVLEYRSCRVVEEE